MLTVKSNKDFIEKINAKSWQYFDNILLPELLTRRLDNSLENKKLIASSFDDMIAYGNSNCRIKITRAVNGKLYC